MLDPESSQDVVNGCHRIGHGLPCRAHGGEAGGPGDDLISLMLNHVRSGDLTVHEVSGMAAFLLMAGHETTGNMISLRVVRAARASRSASNRSARTPRSCRARWRNCFGISTSSATCPVSSPMTSRWVSRSSPRGELVMVALDAANRDPKVFENPDTLDDPPGCPRAHRLRPWHPRVPRCTRSPVSNFRPSSACSSNASPRLRLAVPADEVPLKDGAKIFGVKSLPLTW